MNFEELQKILPNDPLIWTKQDVSQWLNFIGLSKHTEKFNDESIDGSVLCSLNDDDLKNDLNVTSSIQLKKFKNWINGLRQYSLQLRTKRTGIIQISLCDLKDEAAQSQTIQEVLISEVINFEPGEEKILLNDFPTNMRLAQCNGQLDSSSEEEEEVKEDDEPTILNRRSLRQQQQQPQQQYLHNANQQHVRDNRSNSPFYKEADNKTPPSSSPNVRAQGIKSENHLPSLQPLKSEELTDLASDQTNSECMLIIAPFEDNQLSHFCVKKEGNIGRHSMNQIVILEESISRQHAKIEQHAAKYYIFDVGSSTGTYIKISDRIHISLNQVIEMGSYQFEVTQLNATTRTISLATSDPNTNQPSVYNLVIKNNDSVQGTSYLLIGRQPQNQICLDDQHLSNVHAKIYILNDKFYLEDNSSTNGTWIRLSKEGVKSPKWEILDEMVIKIGIKNSYKCSINKGSVQKDQNTDLCYNCNQEGRDALFQPCRHNNTCMKCASSLQNCPVCNVKIQQIQKIFKA